MEKIRETLRGQFELWHAIIGFLLLISGFIWTGAAQYANFNNRIVGAETRLSSTELGIHEVKVEMKRMSENVLTNNPIDKQNWIDWREGVVSRQASYEANQQQIIDQLKQINNQLARIKKLD